ncbi:MAG: SagB/ThcOx family dehydrogenase [Syntrophaceae bacterium]|nr:SagB/ThcOx family dehydrogenase [Syntrophaceae bacterium]
MDLSEMKIGQRFQQETKYYRPAHRSKPPERVAEFLQTRKIPLPPPHLDGGPSLWKALRERRSIRDYSPAPLSLKDLSALLWATQGITEKAFAPWYRTAPSAGALHPIDTYLVVNRVEGMDPGIYFFEVVEFSLILRREGDFSGPIARAALDQEIAQSAAVVFVWVAVIQRSRQKYRQRAYRYIYLDCGHIAQNLYLAATALGLGCCGIAAIFDDEVNDLVGVDGQEETAIYLATVGKK